MRVRGGCWAAHWGAERGSNSPMERAVCWVPVVVSSVIRRISFIASATQPGLPVESTGVRGSFAFTVMVMMYERRHNSWEASSLTACVACQHVSNIEEYPIHGDFLGLVFQDLSGESKEAFGDQCGSCVGVACSPVKTCVRCFRLNFKEVEDD